MNDRIVRSPFVARALEGTLSASDRTGLVRDVPVGPRAQRRIDRMRTQVQPSASRVRFDVSGRPDMAAPSVWRNAEMFGLRAGKDAS